MLTIVLSATMADGTVIVERTADLDLLAALVREFRADGECSRLGWAVERADPTPLRTAGGQPERQLG